MLISMLIESPFFSKSEIPHSAEVSLKIFCQISLLGSKNEGAQKGKNIPVQLDTHGSKTTEA